MITRRFALAAAVLAALPSRLRASPACFGDLPAELARIEAASGGRLGVAVLDTGSGARSGDRADERFPMCSTFKVLAAAAILARGDAGSESLERVLPYSERDLVDYSPVTKARVGEGGLPIATLCEAAITLSDNTAGNLLLGVIGGPAGLTAFARSLGDAVTRLDRTEPALNEALPNDPRDTTSPVAMLGNLNRLVLGDALSAGSRGRLAGWLKDNRTGGKRLRAGLPEGWSVGDKTGSGDRGTTNDVAVLWPPESAPLLVTIYLTGTEADADARNATIAEVGRAVAAAASR